jgi:type III pantothenate kinase
MINFPVDQLQLKDIDLLKQEYPTLRNVIVSSVKNCNTDLLKHLKNNFNFVLELDHNTPLPIENCYKSPETLGKDRIAAAAGAHKLYPNQNILIIDAGTAITYDYINEKGQYKGGFITPGLTMRFKALHNYTDKLPLLKPGIPENHNGTDTESSIRGGIQMGLTGEINHIIKHFNKLKENLILILSGGDQFYFDKLLKNYNFVALEITLIGLNSILEFNYTDKV